MSATTRELLIAARALIAKPERWCQGAAQRGEARCAAEAMHHAAVESGLQSRYYDMRRALREVIGYIPVSSWNDAPNRTHAEVLAAFGRAIEGAE